MRDAMKQWLRETHGPFFELFRHFLRNFFASDLVSDPRQANTVLIAVVPVLFQWFFLLIEPLAHKYGHLSALASPGPYRAAVKADELWLITLIMGCIGVLTAMRWQSLFPDLRDYRALGTRCPFAPRKFLERNWRFCWLWLRPLFWR